MRSTPEAPALIQYACERCKTRFVLPPSSRRLNLAGKFRAFSMGVGRTLKQHEGLGAGYDTSRRQLLAKMDDEAYQSFVQSFRFCHECRQFVCNECWSTSRRSCLTCVAKSMTGTVRPRPPFAPTGPEIPRPVVAAAAPRRGRLRRDIALVALAIAVVLVSIEGGVLLVGAASGPGQAASPTDNIAAVASPSASPELTESPSPSPMPTDTPLPSDTPSASPSPSESPSPSPSASTTPTPTPRPATPKPVNPLLTPKISCSYGADPSTVATCRVTNGTGSNYSSKDKFSWNFDGEKTITGKYSDKPAFAFLSRTAHWIQLTVSRSGTASKTAQLTMVP